MIHGENYMRSKNWRIIIARNDLQSTTNIRLVVMTKEIQNALGKGFLGQFQSYENHTFKRESMMAFTA